MKSWCANKPVGFDSKGFAQEWRDAWNAHDLPRILSHYTDDVIFRSRKAEALVGTGELHGKDALRTYWAKALERQPTLRFDVQDVFLGHRMMVLTYTNHKGVHAAETLMFNDDRLVWQASACHRADA